MTDQQYQLVFCGEIAPGQDLARVKTAVRQLSRCDDRLLARLFSGEPVVVKTALDGSAAEKFKHRFEQTGAICRVEPVGGDVDLPATMTCPKCDFVQAEQQSCSRCGVMVAKYRLRQEAESGAPVEDLARASATTAQPGVRVGLWRLLLPVDQGAEPMASLLKGLVLIGLLVWGGRFVLTPLESNYAGESLLHLVNLPFHEAGHVLFRPLGRFMTSLGGSLSQVMVPLICLVVLLFQTRDVFGAAVCLWWAGQNLVDLAPYINDARAGVLPLLGGNTGQSAPYGFHDWEFILTETGLLRYDHLFARMAHYGGGLLMLLAIGWAGYVVYRQWRCSAVPA